jgi:hypothetical protein
MKSVFKILFFAAFVCFVNPVFSQKDKLEALRAEFISKKLEFSTSESEKFWPIYNELNDKIKSVRKNLRQSYKKLQEPLTDAEAEELYKLELQSKQAEVDLQKNYSEKLKVIIGVKKMVKLRLAEDQFKREIINTLKDKSD